MGFDVPKLKPCMYVVLSRLKGTKGAHYAEMELKKLADGNSLHCHWELFATEIKGLFCPMLQQDWAQQALKKLKQMDNMSTVTPTTKFMKLKYYAKTNNLAAVSLLKDNVHPCIHFQLFSTGRRSADYDATLIAIKEIGTNLKAYYMFTYARQEAGPSKMIHQMETMEVGPSLDLDNKIRAVSWDDNKKMKGKAPAP